MCGISSSFLLFNSILLVNIFYFNYLYVFMHQLLNYQNNRKKKMKEFLSQLRNKEIALCKKLHDLYLT